MIKYRAGYKYQLAEDYQRLTSVIPHQHIHEGFLFLDLDGLLIIRKGYAWDGASGPAIDTENIMEGSLVHDALYQLMRSGKLPASHRDDADEEMKLICAEKGMSNIRSWWIDTGLELFGAAAADPKNKKEVFVTP